jgi:hypothetical protein
MTTTTTTPTRLLICQAIGKQRLLMFGYGDVVRVVEPHLFGLNSAGHEMLSAWLRPDQSRSDPEGGWRNYLSDDITNLQMLDETFEGECGRCTVG